jgi:hypothetical protein
MMKLIRISFGGVIAFSLAACASAANRTQSGLEDAALSPLTDLNIRRDEIPALLVSIRSPYEPVPEVTCRALGQMIVELSSILGSDFDAEPEPEKSFGDKAGEDVADLTLDSISSTMSDLIPFRSLVRDATGASRHERRLRAAYERGAARRAYLKGIGAHLGCAPPAAPDPSAGIPRGEDAEFKGTSQAD